MPADERPLRARRRDTCTGDAARSGLIEQNVIERLQELRPLIAEYEELRRWARALGLDDGRAAP